MFYKYMFYIIIIKHIYIMMIDDNNKNIIEHNSYKYLLSCENIIFYACTTGSNNGASSVLN